MKFIVDSMLGKLAKRLRLLGYDTYYDAEIDDREILKIARNEKRQVVTRDRGIARIRGSKAILITSTDVHQQLKELARLAGIKLDESSSFSRCSECNSPVVPADREDVKSLVPKLVYETMKKFSFCPKCKKAYWQGTHYDRLLKELKEF